MFANSYHNVAIRVLFIDIFQIILYNHLYQLQVFSWAKVKGDLLLMISNGIGSAYDAPKKTLSLRHLPWDKRASFFLTLKQIGPDKLTEQAAVQLLEEHFAEMKIGPVSAVPVMRKIEYIAPSQETKRFECNGIMLILPIRSGNLEVSLAKLVAISRTK